MHGVQRYPKERTEIFLEKPEKASKRRENLSNVENEEFARQVGKWTGRLMKEWNSVFKGQSQHGLLANLSAAAWWH